MTNGGKAKDRYVPQIGNFFMKHMLKLRRKPEKIRAVLVTAGIKSNMSVLDYGTGVGNYAIEAAKLVGTGGAVVGADINYSMLKELEKRCRKESITNVKTLQFHSHTEIIQKFDYILLLDVLHFIGEKEELIDYLLTLLQPGGQLVIKFEHFRNEDVDQLLERCHCGAYTFLGDPKFWILTR